jgi:hypothetical protein
MDDETNFYLVFLGCKFPSRGLVGVNVRISGEPEITAETNELSIEDIRAIFTNYFKTPAEQLDTTFADCAAGTASP